MKVVYKMRTPWYYYVTPKRWMMYFMWLLSLLVDKYNRGQISAITYCEQIIWRRQCCIQCNKTGKAQCCNCDFDGLVKQKNGYCSNGMWDEMLNDEEWKKFKIDNNITNIKI